ncbi:MAG: thioesterase family protein [Verrucomicrobiota bacterium]
MSREFECVTEEEVMFYDTDCGAVVHNLAYLRMVEKCRTKLAALMGFQLREMGETGVFPVVVRTEADYRKPGRLGDELEIRGWLAEWGKARFWCEFEVMRGEELLLTARQSLALVQMPEGKVLRLGEIPRSRV